MMKLDTLFTSQGKKIAFSQFNGVLRGDDGGRFCRWLR